jgi:hypothetical protein
MTKKIVLELLPMPGWTRFRSVLVHAFLSFRVLNTTISVVSALLQSWRFCCSRRPGCGLSLRTSFWQSYGFQAVRDKPYHIHCREIDRMVFRTDSLVMTLMAFTINTGHFLSSHGPFAAHSFFQVFSQGRLFLIFPCCVI